MYNSHDLARIAIGCLINGVFWTILYWAFFAVFHHFDIHRKYGIFKIREPEVHYRTALKNWKIPFLWGIGTSAVMALYGLKLNSPLGNTLGRQPELVFSLPPEYIFLHSPNLFTDILYGIVGFYLVDFTDYWAHRIGHRYPFMYKKFPFAHFVHHNWTFLNPLVVVSSPTLHPAVITGSAVYVFLLSQGLLLPVLFLHLVKIFSNYMSHLGCDPFPGLTRLNHRVGGWIPWIPLHHQYHHLHFTRQGNYGNLSCLWDYVFGTLIPESVYHIERGEPAPSVIARLGKPEEQLEADMGKFLQGKTGLSLR
ncbi:MAG: sterol desaturase family protein [Gemmatimonadaceae bacterium]|nr:sterol desaturase family protein [Gloeobacterales cyanobacterium ES-bin-141]